MTEPAAISRAVAVGVQGLATLQKYTRLSADARSWQLTLEQDPLGEAAYQASRAEAMAAAAAAARASAKLPPR